MYNFDVLDNYLETHLDKSIDELSRLVAQPSISTQNIGLDECAEMVGQYLEKRGFQVELVRAAGAPVVVAEKKGKSEKTLLFYNHYDVQPPEPLELWVTPPFEPSIRDGKIYGRGVNDDKGQICYRLLAIDAILDTMGELPCNVKFVIEGEEEGGSENLQDFMKNNYHKLKADACIWEFGSVDHNDRPVEYLGLRGIIYVELSVKSAEHDIHSGIGGSIFPNAAWRLVWALNSLKGPDERVRIPGFYDAVKPPSKRDIELMAALPETSDQFIKDYQIKGFLKGMTGGTELRVAEVFEPTCTICGLTSGYQGPGTKTVLPAKASAKVDFRLVPDMDPDRVLKQLRDHLDAEGFDDVEITSFGGGAAARTDPDDPFVKIVVETATDVYGSPMQVVPMIGGSGPNHLFSEYLKVPIVTAGAGDPGSGSHAPNENLRLDLYLKAAKHLVRIMKAFSE